MNPIYKNLKSLVAAAGLLAVIAITGCGNDDPQVTAGPVPGVAGAGVVPQSNCVDQFGMQGVLVNGQCVANQFNGNQSYCQNGIMNNGYYMCPCTGTTGGTVVVTPPGGAGGFCNGFQPIYLNGQYYYYITPNTMWPQYYPQQRYQYYYWNGRTWVIGYR